MTNPSGAPVSGALVSYSGGTTYTDTAGAYQFDGVPPGTIQLMVSASGYPNQVQSVTVVARATVSADFTLSATALTWSSDCNWSYRLSGYGQQVCHITVNGTQRTIGLHIPTQHDAANPKMLVIWLHPSGGGNHTGCLDDWYTYLDPDGTVLVCPDGEDPDHTGLPTWNILYCYTGGGAVTCAASHPQVPNFDYVYDDAALVRAIALAAEQKLAVNPNYVMTTGLSAGASMQGRLAMDDGDIISSALPVSGTHLAWDAATGPAYAANTSWPAMSGTVSWLVLRGVSETMPVCSNTTTNGHGLSTLDEELNYFATRNNCTTERPNSNPFCIGGRGGTLSSERWKKWSGCSNGVEVRAYLLENGVHREYSSSYDLSSASGCATPPCPYNSQLGVDFTRPVYESQLRYQFFKAHAKTRQLTVGKSGNGNGMVSGDTISCGGVCSEKTVPGTVVTLTATPSSGSQSGSWTGCDSISGSACTVTMSANKTVTVQFN